MVQRFGFFTSFSLACLVAPALLNACGGAEGYSYEELNGNQSPTAPTESTTPGANTTSPTAPAEAPEWNLPMTGALPADQPPTSAEPAPEEEPADVSPTPAPPSSGFGRAITGTGYGDNYQTFDIQIGGDSYKVQTNPWGCATQTIAAGNGNVFTVQSIVHPTDWCNDINQAVEPWSVSAFPSVYKGVKYGGGDGTSNSGMPRQISAISSVYTGVKHNSMNPWPDPAGDYYGNATYDTYFTNNQSYSGGPPDTYLMVWLASKRLNPISSDGASGCDALPPSHIGSCTERGSILVHG
ncbi:MAG: hypothetical protein MK135_01955, partial [Polyangiaceae bacterium]|nr:hypothetical protein [Polyangiaceae bacterium]